MYRADVYVAGANDGTAALAAWAECSLLIMHGDAAAAAQSSSARSQSVTVVSEAGGEPLCAGGWATIPAPQKKPQLAMEEQQRPPRPSRTAIRAKTNSFELLRLLPPPVSPTLGVGTELEIVEPLLQQAKEGVGRKSSRPGSPAPRKKKQGHDVQRRRSDQHRGHPGPEKPSGGSKHRSSGDFSSRSLLLGHRFAHVPCIFGLTFHINMSPSGMNMTKHSKHCLWSSIRMRAVPTPEKIRCCST